jgi:hypothetical protein
LRIFFIIAVILFIGCNNKEKHPKKQIKKLINKNKNETNITIIKLNDCNLTFKNNQMIYPNQKIYILFDDNSTYSKMQKEVLKQLNVKFYQTHNEYLKKYFKISIYPTTIILDKNKTTKFENFTPIEILKGF